MLDEYSQRLVAEAHLPSQVSHEVARDLLSLSYLRWVSEGILTDHPYEGNPADSERLARLSLAVSLLHSPEEDQETAFLVAEASDLSRRCRRPVGEPTSALETFRRAVRGLDLATYFHQADYDSNAQVVANEALGLLMDSGLQEYMEGAELSYYRCLAFFLQARFVECRSEAETHVDVSGAPRRAFAFLRARVRDLCARYETAELQTSSSDDPLLRLRTTLRSGNHGYFSLAGEAARIYQLEQLVGRKSAFHALSGLVSEQYLRDRVVPRRGAGRPFLWPPLRDFAREFLSGRCQHAVVTAPTGSGKSVLAEMAAATALQQGWVLYMAPTNALCAQIRTDLESGLRTVRNGAVEAFLGQMEYVEEMPQQHGEGHVLVVTPEKALLLLKRDPARFSECALVVFDECHLLSLGDRGAIAEIVLSFVLSRNPVVRVLLMSALVEDGGSIADWLRGATGGEVAQIDTSWRPTRTARIVVLPEVDDSKQEVPEHTGGSFSLHAYADVVTPWRSTPAPVVLADWALPVAVSSSRPNSWPRNEVARRLAELAATNGLQVLVFTLKNRHHAFSMAARVSIAPASELPSQPPYDAALLALARYELGANSALGDLIRLQGAAVYTSAMLDCERDAANRAFRSGQARVLFATSTLSQGLNLPAEAVVICGTEYDRGDEDEDPSTRQLRSMGDVLNAMGRAARASTACRGFAIIVPDDMQKIPRRTRTHLGIGEKIPALQRHEASLPVTSSLQRAMSKVVHLGPDDELTPGDRMALAWLPADAQGVGDILRHSLALAGGEHAIEAVTARVTAVTDLLAATAHPIWLASASSLAGMDISLAVALYDFIVLSDQSGSTPKADSYQSWAQFLVDWLSTLPAETTWRLLQSHIRAWRKYRGRKTDQDPDVIGELIERGYPAKLDHRATLMLAPIWANLRQVLDAWLTDASLLEIAEELTRTRYDADRVEHRTDAGHPLPRAIGWTQRVPEELSRYAGLLMAVREAWLLSDESALPGWLAGSMALGSLSSGMRYGVQQPGAVAWYRYAISERRCANLLQDLVPAAVKDFTDMSHTRRAAMDARSTFLRSAAPPGAPAVLHAVRQVLGGAM